MRDVHDLAEWLLGQSGEYDDYLRESVVRLQAYEYQNTSKSGNAYRTVQLKELLDRAGNGPQGPAPSSPEPIVWGQGSSAADAPYENDELLF